MTMSRIAIILSSLGLAGLTSTVIASPSDYTTTVALHRQRRPDYPSTAYIFLLKRAGNHLFRNSCIHGLSGPCKLVR